MSLTYKQIQDEVISLRFSESDRASVKNWINIRLAEVWSMEEWLFRRASASVSVTSGSTGITNVPSTFGTAHRLYRSDGIALRYIEPADYYDIYANQLQTGTPVDYTIINQTFLVGPVSGDTASDYLLLYEKRLTPLVADTDVPLLPGEYHYMLVPGAISFGMGLKSDFTFQFVEMGWQAAIASMRHEYLVDQRGESVQWGADPFS